MKNMFSQKTAPRAQKRLRIIPNKSARTLFKHYCCPTITVALKRNRHRKISYRYNGITYIWAFVPTIRAKQQAYTLKWMIFFLFSFCLLCFAYSSFFFRCRFCCYLSIVFFFLSFVRTFVGFIRLLVHSFVHGLECVSVCMREYFYSSIGFFKLWKRNNVRRDIHSYTCQTPAVRAADLQLNECSMESWRRCSLVCICNWILEKKAKQYWKVGVFFLTPAISLCVLSANSIPTQMVLSILLHLANHASMLRNWHPCRCAIYLRTHGPMQTMTNT